MNTKHILLILGLVLIVAILAAGCSSSSETTSTQAPTPKTTTVKTPIPTQTQATTGITVKVDYSGKWQGALGAGGGVKSVSGTGMETFDLLNDVAFVSVNAQKMDDSSKTLTVSILQNGKVIATENTNAAYGVAMTSASV